MDLPTIARALHVLGVVVWIGGVGFVTLVLVPALRRSVPAAERLQLFEMMEGRFATLARFSTLLVGATGLWMAWTYDLWAGFIDPARWWLAAMVLVWAIFTLMLFVLEPFVLHRRFHARAARDPEGTFALIQRVHLVLLALSLLTVAGAVLGVHGGL